MKRLNILAKGNLDLRDTLHSLELDGQVQWNGINQAMRERGGGPTVRIRHETSVSSAATLQAPGEIPDAFAGRTLPLDPYPLEIQFGRTIFDFPADAIVLSIQSDMQVTAARHRRDGFIFYPQAFEDWEEEDREWLFREFEPLPLPGADEAMDNLEKLVLRLRETSDAPILIYNVSSVVPGESVHCHAGLNEILSERIKRFNLALIDLSARTGISIVDVDRIVAEQGSRTMKIDATHLTAQACRAVAAEVIRILENLGCIPPLEGPT